MIKLGLLAVGVGSVRAAAGVVPDDMTASATEIAAIVAGLVALGWLYRHVVKPFAQLIARALTSWEVFEDLPESLSEIRRGQQTGMQQLGDRLGTVEGEVEVIKKEVAELREPFVGLARELGVETRKRP